jgi:hypothetical protein
MELDTELPADQHQLQELVQREATKIADKRMNTLRQEIASIKELLSKKNTGRGQTSNGASTKRNHKGGGIFENELYHGSDIYILYHSVRSET